MFYVSTTTLPVCLPPFWTGNEEEGVNNYLKSNLAKYSPSLNGFLLAFSNVVLNPIAKIQNESPFLHIKASVDLMHFSPKKTDYLFGVVNKLSEDHIGLLVYGIFNASIAGANHYFTYSAHEDVLEYNDVKIGVGSILKFEVTDIQFDGDFWSISGTLKSKNSGLVDGIIAPLPSFMESDNHGTSLENVPCATDDNNICDEDDSIVSDNSISLKKKGKSEEEKTDPLLVRKSVTGIQVGSVDKSSLNNEPKCEELEIEKKVPRKHKKRKKANK